MSIEYRTIDAAASEENILRQRAVEAESVAYQKEVEILRLAALEKVVTSKEDKAALKEAAKIAKAEAAEERTRAKRLNKGKVAPAEDLTGARRTFLEQWIASLESEHVSHATLLKQREASLATTGDLAPGAEHAEQIKANIKTNQDSLKVIESAWKVAVKELDALPE